MSYAKDFPPSLFVLRTSKSQWYKSVSGTSAPQLFSERGARTVLKNESRFKGASSDGPYEMIPVALVFGTPINPSEHSAL